MQITSKNDPLEEEKIALPTIRREKKEKKRRLKRVWKSPAKKTLNEERNVTKHILRHMWKQQKRIWQYGYSPEEKMMVVEKLNMWYNNLKTSNPQLAGEKKGQLFEEPVVRETNLTILNKVINNEHGSLLRLILFHTLERGLYKMNLNNSHGQIKKDNIDMYRKTYLKFLQKTKLQLKRDGYVDLSPNLKQLVKFNSIYE